MPSAIQRWRASANGFGAEAKPHRHEGEAGDAAERQHGQHVAAGRQNHLRQNVGNAERNRRGDAGSRSAEQGARRVELMKA